MAGAFFNRYKWMRFRNRFNNLRLSSFLDYGLYRRLPDEGGVFRFTGGIESITDGHTLWVKGEDLTVPVSLEKTKCYLLPTHEDTGPKAPEQIRWNTVCTLTEGAKVFIGGQVKTQNNRLNFCSTKEEPLMVIFYNCPDDDLPQEIISGARTRNEYWNYLTPISLVIGALSLIYIAASFIGRTAYYLTVISAIIAVFIPILPIFPPGLLLAALHRRLAWNVRKLKANLDLMRFGLLQDNSMQQNLRHYTIRAIILETISWLLILSGVLLNIVFIFALLVQFQVITL